MQIIKNKGLGKEKIKWNSQHHLQVLWMVDYKLDYEGNKRYFTRFFQF
jgi:hypothetical protein